MVTTMFVCKDALNAQCLTAFVTESLNWLHISDVTVAILCDNPILVHKRLVSFQIQ